MRTLLNHVDPSVPAGQPLDEEALARLYAYPDPGDGGPERWLRANMVGTLDGAATGADGKTGSINNEPDHRVFTLLRALADVIVVGAGTAREEGYRAPRPVRGARAALRAGRRGAPALAVVSRTANLPLQLTLPADEDAGEVLLVTSGAAEESAVAAAREALGDDQVVVLGRDGVDLDAMTEHLVERGLSRMLTEGGPHLLRDMVAAGVVDEICLTVVPQLVGGDHLRILAGDGVDVALEARLLLEAEGTLLGRWWTA
jgi:riboflavin biosynthesis pyrimidine reductase